MKLRIIHLATIFCIGLLSASILFLSNIFFHEYFEVIGTVVILIIASTPCIFCIFELTTNKQWILFSLFSLNIESGSCDTLEPPINKPYKLFLLIAYAILYITITSYIYKTPHSFHYSFNASCAVFIVLGVSIILSQLMGMYVYLIDLLDAHNDILNTSQLQLIINKLLRQNQIGRISFYAFFLCLPFIAIILTILLWLPFIPIMNKYLFVYFFLGISFYALIFVLFRFFLSNNLIMIISALKRGIANEESLFYRDLLKHQQRMVRISFIILLFMYPAFFYVLTAV
jgi:hypothetical protein